MIKPRDDGGFARERFHAPPTERSTLAALRRIAQRLEAAETHLSAGGGRRTSAPEVLASYERGGDRYVIVRLDAKGLTALTARQVEVVLLIWEGRTDKEIARELKVSRARVVDIGRVIRRKLKVETRTEIAIKAFLLGISRISGGPPPEQPAVVGSPR